MANNLTPINTLSPRANAFVTAYLADPERNATKAYKAAGFAATGSNARVCAHQLLHDPRVQQLIVEHDSGEVTRARNRAGVNLEKTLQSIARSAFADVRRLFNEDGSPKQVSELDDDIAMAIEGVEVVETYAGTGEERTFTGYVKKYKLSPRAPHRDMLMKHLNGYKAEKDGEAKAQANALVEMLSQMRRSALPVVERVDHDENV